MTVIIMHVKHLRIITAYMHQGSSRDTFFDELNSDKSKLYQSQLQGQMTKLIFFNSSCRQAAR
jgi:hypothetical protein